VPLLLLRDDGLSRRWLSEAEHLRDGSRTQWTWATLEAYGGDLAAALSRARANAQKHPGDSEALRVRDDLAVLAGAKDAESLSEAMFRDVPEAPGVLLQQSGRLRHAYFLQRRRDARARGLIEESDTRARARIASGDVAAATFLEAGAARALLGDKDGALTALERAYDAGWRDYGIAAIDPMLAGVREEPRFRALIGRATHDVAAQRERARQRGLLDLAPLLGRATE
jgi:hypothetical protein